MMPIPETSVRLADLNSKLIGFTLTVNRTILLGNENIQIE